MDAGVVNIKIHHGGSFSKDGVLTYVGGQVSYFRNCEVDRFSYFELIGMLRDIGFNDGDKIFYTIPGYSLEAGIDQIHDDNSVSRMLKLARPNMFLEIYVQHIDQDGVSANASLGEAMEDVNMKEKLKTNSKKEKNVASTKKRDRRVWSQEEEACLIDLLYDMNNTGWKVDTGHKSGYLAYIEKEMAKKFPSSGIRADPHIKSKVKILKKHLSWILEIQQNGSGFGWDDDKKMVTGEKEIFMGWAKSREGSSCLWMKPMVHYDKLVEIYANDLAKGNKVKGPGDDSDMDEDTCSTLNEESIGNLAGNDSGSAFQSQGIYNTPTTSRQSNKRKSCETDPLEAEFIQISKSISALLEVEKENALAMNDIKRAFVHDVDLHERTLDNRKQLFQILSTLPDLTPEQVVKATRLIGQDATKMDMFLNMPDNFKGIFVLQEINGDK